MTVHHFLQCGFRGLAQIRQDDVQGIEFEKIPMTSDRRAWPAITRLLPVIHSFKSAGWKRDGSHRFGQPIAVAREVVQDPVHPDHSWGRRVRRVRVIDDQCQALSITRDAGSIEAYFQLLDGLPCGKRLDAATTARARKYAYHFFFRRMIPLEFMQPVEGYPPNRLVLQDLAELERGRSKGLDVICDGILNGSDFIYPAETLLNPR